MIVPHAGGGDLGRGLPGAVDRGPLVGNTTPINGYTKEAAAAGETPLRLNLVAAWRHTTVFTEAELAALALTEEGTRLGDAYQGVSDQTWVQVRAHFDDDQVGALVCLVALINAANRMSVILHNQGGSYWPGMFAAFE